MTNSSNSTPPSPSPPEGWILVVTLLIALFVQGTVLCGVELLRMHLSAGRALHSALQSTHPTAEPQKILTHERAAPDGWDHALFTSEIREICYPDGSASLSWRVRLREQPACRPAPNILSSRRPAVLVMIDDSESMTWSAGKDYVADKIYLRLPGGEVVCSPRKLAVTESISTPEGLYFKGDYGNRVLRAPFASSRGGAMSCWTDSHDQIDSLLDQLARCDVALGTTGTGLVQDFTRDARLLHTSLANIHPGQSISPLARSLTTATTLFASNCATSRHIILVTDGQAIGDGPLPPGIADFDGDGDPLDQDPALPGSHCLDDVAAFLKDKGITVHILGPDSPLIRSTCTAGGGAHRPQPADLLADETSVTQTPILCHDTALLPEAHRGTFAPSWITSGPDKHFRLTAGSLHPSPPFALAGALAHVCTDGTALYGSTDRAQLFKADPRNGHLHWIISGMDGPLCVRGGLLFTGPDHSDTIHVLAPGPAPRWHAPAEHMASSTSTVYTASGPTIVARDLADGQEVSRWRATQPITCLRFDPASGLVLAGTATGTIAILSRELIPQHHLFPPVRSAILDIRAFHLGRTLHLAVVTADTLACISAAATRWSMSLPGDTLLSALVMNHRIRLLLLRPATGCPGLDAGSTHQMVFDVRTGILDSDQTLTPGRAFGPLVDLDGTRLLHATWDGDLISEDLSEISGIAFISLGNAPRTP